MKIKKLLLPTLLFGFFLNLNANIAAPSGLEWGKSKSNMTADGYTFSGCTLLLEGAIEYCNTVVKKPISFAESYTVYFIEDYGLLKVWVSGQTISSDIYGTNGKEKYNGVKKSLINKYSESEGYKANSYEWISQKLYNESDEFYQCLAYDGCGTHITYISSKDDASNKGIVSVELLGLNRGSGYISLTYESDEWGEALDSANAKQNQADEDAF